MTLLFEERGDKVRRILPSSVPVNPIQPTALYDMGMFAYLSVRYGQLVFDSNNLDG